MPRRFNYTGRQRIRRAHAQILLADIGAGRTEYVAELDLRHYSLPPEARVHVEAYRQTSFMRFDHGTVGESRRPESSVLTQFETAEGVLFRVKITSVGEEQGRLLALAEKLRPRNPQDLEGVVPLLPVVPQDLKAELWRVDFEDQPRLLVNKHAGDIYAIVRSREFRSLVYPTILRTVLTQIVVIQELLDPEDEEDPNALWLRFAVGLPGGPGGAPPEGRDEQSTWIDDVVAAFARRIDALRTFELTWQDGQAR